MYTSPDGNIYDFGARFEYDTPRYRVYEITDRIEAIRFCEMFGGRFAFSLAAPVDRYVIIVD